MVFQSRIMFGGYSFFLLVRCPFFIPMASVALNETRRVHNGNTATEDPPPAKKTRRCQRQGMKKEPVTGGEANNDRTEDKQGQLQVVGQGGHELAGLCMGGVRTRDALFFNLLLLRFLKI